MHSLTYLHTFQFWSLFPFFKIENFFNHLVVIATQLHYNMTDMGNLTNWSVPTWRPSLSYQAHATLSPHYSCYMMQRRPRLAPLYQWVNASHQHIGKTPSGDQVEYSPIPWIRWTGNQWSPACHTEWDLEIANNLGYRLPPFLLTKTENHHHR